MKAALRDARVDAAVERAKEPKPKRNVTPKPVAPSKYPRLAHDSANLGTLVVRKTQRLRGTRIALAATPSSAHDAKARGPLMPRVKSPGKKRRAVRKWYRENVVGKLTVVSRAAAQHKGTRTPERRAEKAHNRARNGG